MAIPFAQAVSVKHMNGKEKIRKKDLTKSFYDSSNEQFMSLSNNSMIQMCNLSTGKQVAEDFPVHTGAT